MIFFWSAYGIYIYIEIYTCVLHVCMLCSVWQVSMSATLSLLRKTNSASSISCVARCWTTSLIGLKIAVVAWTCFFTLTGYEFPDSSYVFDCSSRFLVCQFWWQFYFSMAGAPQTCCWDRAKISGHPMPIPPVAKHTALIWWKMTQIQRGTAQGSLVKACTGFWILSIIYINIYTHVHIYLYTCISINTVWQYM